MAIVSRIPRRTSKIAAHTHNQQSETLFDDMPQKQPTPKRARRFSVKLTGAFALTALMTAAVASAILGIVWNQQFEGYRRTNINNAATSLADTIGVMYTHAGGWTPNVLAPVADYWNSSNIGARVTDKDGKVLADSTGHLTGDTPAARDSGSTDSDATAGEGPQNNQPRGMLGELIAGNQTPEYSAQAPIITAGGETVGMVSMWVYGKNTLLSQDDLEFRAKSYQAMAFAAIITVILASLAGWIFSAQLVGPINRITATARRIRSGDEKARTNLTSDDEIGELGRTFDEMAQAIEQDRELERRLTSDVAHELRTPLMAIQATVEAMQDGVLPADEEHLYRVSNETVRLSRLVDAILELTRLERGSLPFNMTNVNVSDLVTEIVNAHEALFDASEIQLSSSVAADVIVCGDADRLRQAFGNLLSNAARYTPEGGSVSVSLTCDRTNAVFEVADTGIGIEAENLNRVFSRFWRADGARNRAHGGLGIGLAVTKEIVDRHNGTIMAYQREDGQTGSVFAITIPLYKKSSSKTGSFSLVSRGSNSKSDQK